MAKSCQTIIEAEKLEITDKQMRQRELDFLDDFLRSAAMAYLAWVSQLSSTLTSKTVNYVISGRIYQEREKEED